MNGSQMVISSVSVLITTICLAQSPSNASRSPLKVSESTSSYIAVKEYLDELVEEGRIGGAGAMITVDGKTTFTHFTGTQRPGGGPPID